MVRDFIFILLQPGDELKYTKRKALKSYFYSRTTDVGEMMPAML